MILGEVTVFVILSNPSSYTAALGSTRPVTEMKTRHFPGSIWRRIASCEPTVWKMWEPRRLTILWASTAAYRFSSTSLRPTRLGVFQVVSCLLSSDICHSVLFAFLIPLRRAECISLLTPLNLFTLIMFPVECTWRSSVPFSSAGYPFTSPSVLARGQFQKHTEIRQIHVLCCGFLNRSYKDQIYQPG